MYNYKKPMTVDRVVGVIDLNILPELFNMYII